MMTRIPLYLLAIIILNLSNVGAGTIPAVEGSTVTLTCNKIPSDNLVWEHRAIGGIFVQGGVLMPSVTPSKYEVTQSVYSESLVVKSVTLEDDGEYRCYYMSNMNDAEINKINILVQPLTINATGPVDPVSEGTNQTLSCTVYGAKPLPEMKWIQIDSKGHQTELASVYVDTVLPNKTGNRRHDLLLVVTRGTYRSRFVCSASISYFYHMEANVILDVYLLPLVPVISGVASSYDPGRTTNIRCEVNGARPAADISWTMDGNLMQGLNNAPEQMSDGTFVSVGTLLISLPSHEDAVLITCSASNQAVVASGSNPPMTNSSIKVNYAPRVRVNHTAIFAKEGEDSVLECIVMSRPLPAESGVHWWKESMSILGSRYQVGNGSNLSLTIRNITRNDSGRYHCEVFNHLGYANGDPIMLNVMHKPYCSDQQKRRYAVPLGSSATVKCVVEAFPNNVSFFWYYDGVSHVSMSKQGETDPEDREHAYSYLSVDVRRIEDYKSIVCNASSAVGTMMEGCFIHLVKPGPTEAPINCEVVTAGNMSVSLRCVPGFDGGYRQTFTLMQSQDGGQYIAKDTWDKPQFYVSGLIPDTPYSFRVCSRNDRFQDFKNCSSAVTTRTLSGSDDGPDSVRPTAEVAAIGAYIAIAICFVLLVVFVSVVLLYFLVYKRRRDSKSSPGRVVVSRSTGSLIFDGPTKRYRKSTADLYKGEEYGKENAGCDSDKERQLQEIVERIDWQEGVTSLQDEEGVTLPHEEKTITGSDNTDKRRNHKSQSLNEVAVVELSEPSGVKNDCVTTPKVVTHKDLGRCNLAFNDDNVAENVVRKPETRKHLDYSLEDFTIVAETDYDGSSETTLDITDEDSVTKSPSKSRLDENMNKSYLVTDKGLGHQCDLLIRRGSYNLAMGQDGQSLRSTSSEEYANVSNMNDSRYAGVKPAYF